MYLIEYFRVGELSVVCSVLPTKWTFFSIDSVNGTFISLLLFISNSVFIISANLKVLMRFCVALQIVILLLQYHNR